MLTPALPWAEHPARPRSSGPSGSKYYTSPPSDQAYLSLPTSAGRQTWPRAARRPGRDPPGPGSGRAGGAAAVGARERRRPGRVPSCGRWRSCWPAAPVSGSAATCPSNCTCWRAGPWSSTRWRPSTRRPGVDSILVVMPAGLPGPARERFLAAAGYPKVTRVIEGGVTRTDSTRCAIAALSKAEAQDRAQDQAQARDRAQDQAQARDRAQAQAQARDRAQAQAQDRAHDDGDTNVLFHDAARPLLDQRIIADCVAALGHGPGHRGGRPVVGHHRRGQRRRGDGHAAARRAGALPDPAGIPALGDQAGLRPRRRRPGLRRSARPPTTAASCTATCPTSRSGWCGAASATSRSPTRVTWTWPRPCCAGT